MHWQMGELVYFGTPGPTTLDKGSLTLGRSLDVPRISRYDVDTETPRPEKLVVDFDTTVNSSPTDISGNGNHGTFGGNATYSTADKAFKFDGDDDYIQTGSVGLSGTNPVFSVSLWVNYSGGGSETLCMIGDTYGNGTTVWLDISSNSPRIIFVNNDVTFTDPNTGLGASPPNVWNHIVFVYNGTPNGGRSVYVNGVKQVASAAVGTVANGNLVLPSTSVVTIGALDHSSGFIHETVGFISNFKLYNVVLEPSEVKKLYNLGRTGRSMVISDTAVGIGKAPEAQLDVRGLIKASTMYVPGTIIQVRTNDDNNTSTGYSTLNFATTANSNSGNIPIAQATGLKASITPRSKKSRIYVDFHVLLYFPTMTNITGARLQVWRKIGSTYTRVYGAPGGHDLHHYDNHTGSLHTYTRVTFVHNTPNTLEESEYELRAMLYTGANAGSLEIGNGTNQPANCVLMEIAGE